MSFLNKKRVNSLLFKLTFECNLRKLFRNRCHVQKRMLKNLIQSKSFSRINLKDRFYKWLELLTWKMTQSIYIEIFHLSHSIWIERILTCNDFIVNGLLLLSLKRITSVVYGVAHDTKGPYIDLISMPYCRTILVLLNHLWCDVIGSATESEPFFVLLNFCSQSEITNFKNNSIR